MTSVLNLISLYRGEDGVAVLVLDAVSCVVMVTRNRAPLLLALRVAKPLSISDYPKLASRISRKDYFGLII